MHIPDGYLGPPTCAAGFAVMLPIWAVASARIKKTLHAKQVPLLAIAAAFCFVVMMFNIPIPGGSTGHAVGAVLAAILLGPWAACIAVSVALLIQALLFGDGGITAIGANCFNMAFAMPSAGWAVYRLISGNCPVGSIRRAAAAGIAGYIGIIIASLCTGIEFGLQPYLHHSADGRALYCPYGLTAALGAMVGSHVLVFGWIELAATALVVAFLQKQEPSLLRREPTAGNLRKPAVKVWTGLGVLALLSPLGLYLPEKLKAGTAWGEWSAHQIKRMTGFVPAGMEKLSGVWTALMPGYSVNGIGGDGLAYIVSALIGISLCAAAIFLVGTVLSRKKATRADGFLERTLLAAVGLLKETVANEEIAARGGFLQKREPRLKLLSLLVLLAATIFSRSIAPVILLYGLCLLLAVISSVDIVYFLKRTFLFIPLFSLFIAVPALFGVVTPGKTVLPISFAGLHLDVTRQGIDTALLFFARVACSVSLAVLLLLTTRHSTLLKTLRACKVPQVFVMTMSMCYRYIFLFLDLIQSTFCALRSRVGFVTSAKTGRRVVALNIASLWLRSYRLHGQVYDAMVSRGYSGEPVALENFKSRTLDRLLVVFSVLLLIGTLWMNRFFP